MAPTSKILKVIFNSNIWQWNTEEYANWMVITDDHISEIGKGKPSQEILQNCTESVDMKGQWIFPGLIDAHLHIYHMGEASHYVNLTGCQSIAQLQDRVQNHAVQHPDREWIIGFGWEQDVFGVYPTAADIDQVVSDRPVLLWRACWHIAVVNTCALRLAGLLTEPVETSVKGVIDYDSDGNPTGILREEVIINHVIILMRY